LTDHADPRTCPSDLTSDLDEDSEADIIELLERLQRSDGFGFVLVPHNLEAAKHAPRIYLMQQGVLSATDLPEVVTAERRPRHLCAGRQTPAGSVPLKPDRTAQAAC
jgi:ABC-type glutathione transport system ATPase component